MDFFELNARRMELELLVANEVYLSEEAKIELFKKLIDNIPNNVNVDIVPPDETNQELEQEAT